MMHDFFSLDPQTQRELIEATALEMKVDPIIIEKDLWVVLTLEALFQNKDGVAFSDMLVFKGGTSLSKAYSIIQRFSEDIDITIDRRLLGFDFSYDDFSQTAGKKRKVLLEALKIKAHDFIRGAISPHLQNHLNLLFPREEVVVQFSPEDALALEVLYPSRLNAPFASYIKQRVLVEFGMRGDVFPYTEELVSSYLHQTISTMKGRSVYVKTLEPIRTFFEKITLLHAESHRSNEKSTPLRLSRHYYDLFKLQEAGCLTNAQNSLSVLDAVILNKSLLFPSAWASYDAIYTNGLQMLPPNERLDDLKKDYEATKIMIFENPPSFDSIITSIQQMQDMLNAWIAAKKA